MFKSILRRLTKQRFPASAQRACHFKPWLEWLEGRETPAVIPVTTFADVVNPGDGKRSLREAITQANANSDVDTILLQPGTYKIAILGVDEDANVRGDFDITNPLTIKRTGTGKVTIDGQSLDRVFQIFEPAAGTFDVTFANVKIQKGLSSSSGGGIHVAGNTGTVNLTLKSSTITGNQAGSNGGGVYAQEACTLTNSKVLGNFAASQGGGVMFDGTLTISASTISGNFANNNGGGIYALSNSQLTITGSAISNNQTGSNGGGIHANSSTLVLTQCTVSGNTVGSNGGGINTNPDTTLTITQCTISGNTAGDSGGGIHTSTTNTLNVTSSTIRANRSGADGGGILMGSGGSLGLSTSTIRDNTASDSGGGVATSSGFTILRSTLSGNHASNDGGGLHAAGTAAASNLINATFSGNTAHSSGGALYLDLGAYAANLVNVTVAFNRALDGGGIYAASGAINVKNTLIARNTVGTFGVGPDVNGTFVSSGNNLIGIGDGSTGFTAFTDQAGTIATPINPRLGVLSNNGGPTQTHMLKANSPAIDQGNNIGAPGIDQRGKNRPRDGNGDGNAIVDIGAVER